MEPDHSKSPNQASAPTLDGRRLGLNELNLGNTSGRGRFKRFLRHLSQFLAGMYTGESCAGTPHDERRSKPAPLHRNKS
ncbi:hypothetical protein LCGC14_0009440 [marine sediment metagenome]|uniref:Uncharacterized protein n=1 Tax=marine sediment metagenome TaxID=412755 RepID=A0A0F9YKX9_9ZZZZ